MTDQELLKILMERLDNLTKASARNFELGNRGTVLGLNQQIETLEGRIKRLKSKILAFDLASGQNTGR